MLKQKLTIFLWIVGTSFVSTFGLFLPSYVSAGTVLSSHTYAWSNNVGYINFENVTVNDSSLGGHAWSANKGWINFAPAQGGVSNDGTGNLSGSAWGEQLGWIDFDNVSINPSTGQFSGTATSELVGTITFDCQNYCDVETDWRQATTPVAASSGGGGGGSISTTTALDSVTAQAKLVDIQRDGTVNILDFNAIMVNWGSTQNLAAVGALFNPADMNKDGSVDIFDFNTLMVYWGTTYQL